MRVSLPGLFVKGCVKYMYKVAVLGGRETVMGFKALGLDGFPVSVDDAEEAQRAFRSLTRGGSEYAIIYVEEGLAATLKSEIDRFKDEPMPAVILIPGSRGSLGLGRSALSAAVERAIGSNIL